MVHYPNPDTHPFVPPSKPNTLRLRGGMRRTHTRTVRIGTFLFATRLRRVTVAITDKIYLKNHRQIVSQLETSIPKGAFKGATMDVLYSGEGLTKLDDATRDRLLDFAEDFLDPENPDDLYTGYPERQFIQYLLELRAQGLGPDAIVDVMSDEYLLYAYPGDVLSFLDNSVRTLEAAETLAGVDGNERMERKLRRAREALSG